MAVSNYWETRKRIPECFIHNLLSGCILLNTIC